MFHKPTSGEEMKSDFIKGYEEHLLDAPTTEKMMDDAIFVFDTNILLNIYRWKSDTRENFLSCLDKIGEKRIFVTSTIKDEFFRNRVSELIKYDRVRHLSGDVKNAIRAKCTECFDKVSRDDHKDKTLKKLDLILDTMTDSLKDLIDEEFRDKLELFYKDEHLLRLTKLIGHVAKELGSDEVKRLQAQAAEKHQQVKASSKEDKSSSKDQLAGFPGFSDSEKGFGDYVIFHEMQEIAKANKKDIVFVTDEKKQDWFYKVRVESTRPLVRMEVKKAFNSHGVQFDIWDAVNFLKRAGEFTKTPMSDDVIQDASLAAHQFRIIGTHKFRPRPKRPRSIADHMIPKSGEFYSFLDNGDEETDDYVPDLASADASENKQEWIDPGNLPDIQVKPDGKG